MTLMTNETPRGAAPDAVKAAHWRDGEIDANPFDLPAYIAIPAQHWASRAVGFIRYATIYRDAVSANDSSPIFGIRDWSEPITAYEGVAIRVAYRDRACDEPVIIIELRHPVASRSVILHVSFDGTDVSARWRSWGDVLGLPTLVEDRSGDLHASNVYLGRIVAEAPQPHRGASALTWRRPLAFGFTGRQRHWPNRLLGGARPHAY